MRQNWADFSVDRLPNGVTSSQFPKTPLAKWLSVASVAVQECREGREGRERNRSMNEAECRRECRVAEIIYLSSLKWNFSNPIIISKSQNIPPHGPCLSLQVHHTHGKISMP